MEAVSSSETLVNFYRITRRHISEKSNFRFAFFFVGRLGLPTSLCQIRGHITLHNCAISGFRRSCNEIFLLLGFYAATFRDNLSVPFSRWDLLDCLTLEDWKIACPETSALHKVPEESKSQPTWLFVNFSKDVCSRFKIIK